MRKSVYLAAIVVFGGTLCAPTVSWSQGGERRSSPNRTGATSKPGAVPRGDRSARGRLRARIEGGRYDPGSIRRASAGGIGAGLVSAAQSAAERRELVRKARIARERKSSYSYVLGLDKPAPSVGPLGAASLSRPGSPLSYYLLLRVQASRMGRNRGGLAAALEAGVHGLQAPSGASFHGNLGPESTNPVGYRFEESAAWVKLDGPSGVPLGKPISVLNSSHFGNTSRGFGLGTGFSTPSSKGPLTNDPNALTIRKLLRSGPAPPTAPVHSTLSKDGSAVHPQ